MFTFSPTHYSEKKLKRCCNLHYRYSDDRFLNRFNGREVVQVCDRWGRRRCRSKFPVNLSTSVANPVNPEQNVETTAHQMCSTSCPSNSAIKSRQTLSETDKKEQRRRRVLANRESARRTIHCRQAFYSELTQKAAELSAENQHLKREKELVIKDYNSMKTRNECLKVQMAKITEAKTKEIQEESTSAQAEKSTSASRTPPVFLCNQTFGLPVFWPSVGLSSDVFPAQCSSYDDAMSSQLPLQLRDMLYSHQAKDNSTGLNKLGAPLFVFPVPCPCPFLAQSSTLNSQPALNDRQYDNLPSCRCCTCSSLDTLVHADYHQLLPTTKKMPEASSSMQTISLGNIPGTRFSFPPGDGGQQLEPPPKAATHVLSPQSCTGQTASFRRCISAQVDDSSIVEALSSDPEHMAQALLDNEKEIICSRGKSKDNSASTESSRKRKELQNLKNIH